MALDEPKEEDAVFEFDGFKYIIKKGLIEKIQPVLVDFNSMGFRITSNMDRGTGRTRCASSSSGGA